MANGDAERLAKEASERAERLARDAADRAAALMRDEADRATRIAVDRAVKDANIERDLRDHRVRLDEINGSQRDMANSLKGLEDKMNGLKDGLDRQASANNAVAEYIEDRRRNQFSRRTITIAGITALGAYAGLFVALLTHAI